MKKTGKIKYTKLGCLAWAAKNLWRMDRNFCLFLIPTIPLTVFYGLAESYFPKLLLDSLEAKENLFRLTVVITAYLALLQAVKLLTRFFDSRCNSKKYSFSLTYQIQLSQKLWQSDYQLTETQDYQKTRSHAFDDAIHGNCSPEFFWLDLKKFLISLIGIFTYASLLAYLDPVIVAVTAITAAVHFFSSRWEQHYYEKHKDLWEKEKRRKSYLEGISLEFSQAKDIRLYGMQDWIEKMLHGYQSFILMWENRCNLRGTLAAIITAFLTLLQNCTAYLVLIGMLLRGALSVGDFVFYFGIVSTVSMYFSGIINCASELFKRMEKIRYYREYFDYPDSFNHGGGCPLPKGAPKIEFRNVWFKYEGAKDYTLKGIDLTISPGEKLALVGMNGAGKTTLVKLLCGFYMPTKGEIFVGGRPITDYNIDEYYTLISAVFQDVNMCALKIGEFVSSAAPNVPSARTKTEDALRMAGLSEKLSTLPDGIDTYLMKGIYPGAVDLSGGETQKLLLARAIYKNGSILILDEPSSALDPIAENELYLKYNTLTHGKTSLYISHRFASTRFCDRIILLDGGKITESGSHGELMNKCGKYAEMFAVQSRYYREDNVNA